MLNGTGKNAAASVVFSLQATMAISLHYTGQDMAKCCVADVRMSPNINRGSPPEHHQHSSGGGSVRFNHGLILLCCTCVRPSTTYAKRMTISPAGFTNRRGRLTVVVPECEVQGSHCDGNPGQDETGRGRRQKVLEGYSSVLEA